MLSYKYAINLIKTAGGCKNFKYLPLRNNSVSTFSLPNVQKPFFNLDAKEQSRVLAGALKDANIAGKGSEGIVYRIPETQLALKLPQKYKSIPDIPLNKNVSEQEAVNNIRAKIGDDIFIIRYAEGITNRDVIFSEFNRHVGETPVKSFKSYLQQIINAFSKGMKHDSGGSNAILNPETRGLTAIDFYKTNMLSVNLFDDVYLQFGRHMNEPAQVNTLLGKTSLAFLDLIKSNEINPAMIRKFPVSFRKISGVSLSKDTVFMAELEKQLHEITELKQLEKISPDFRTKLADKISILEDYINKNISL